MIAAEMVQTASAASASAEEASDGGGSGGTDEAGPNTELLKERMADYLERAASDPPGSERRATAPTQWSRGRVSPSTGSFVEGSLSSADAGYIAAGPTPIATAAASVKRLLASSAVTEELAVQTSRSLKDAAIKARTQSPRHAALALILSDALAFTSLELPAGENAPAASSLEDGYRALLEPFVGGQIEEIVVRGLLDGGWKLTPAFDAEKFKVLDPEAFE